MTPFHVLYAEQEALIDLRDCRVIRGSLLHRKMALVLEWAAEHRDELIEDWQRRSRLITPRAIEPLEENRRWGSDLDVVTIL